jgi:beta-glucanase (GH16 family)
MPVGVGLWSAFWLYDNCNPEIDFEMYSMNGDYRKCFLRPYAVETCLHTEPEYELKRFPARAPLFSQFNSNPDGDFHVYTIRWKYDLLEWYIDGVRVRRLKDKKTLRYLQDRKMTAILNTYIDGRYQEKFRINSPMEVRYFIHEKI